MDPYTEYLGTGLARREPSYWLPRTLTGPAPSRRHEHHRPLTSRASRWLRRRS